jgi:ferredoxin
MESLISINSKLCRKCGICAEVCPNKIMFKDESGTISVRQDRVQVCFRCGQCMAVCPTKSVSVGGLSYDTDFFELPARIPYEKNFFNMIYTRRAIRNFRDKPVPAELLEKIVKAITFAPPGFPPLKTELIVVQDTGLIKKALPFMIEFYDSLLQRFKNPLIRFIIKSKVGPQMFRTMNDHLIPLMKTRMKELKEGTEDTITRNAPAMILFCADKNGEDIKADIFVAATYGMLAAHSLGLGGSIMDLIPPPVERERKLRKIFFIPEQSEVITSLIIGYPKYKY